VGFAGALQRKSNQRTSGIDSKFEATWFARETLVIGAAVRTHTDGQVGSATVTRTGAGRAIIKGEFFSFGYLAGGGKRARGSEFEGEPTYFGFGVTEESGLRHDWHATWRTCWASITSG